MEYSDETLNEVADLINSMERNDQKISINLYRNYSLINKKYDLGLTVGKTSYCINQGAMRKLNKLEDRIYTINGKVLTQQERIILELKNILKFLSRNKNIPNEIRNSIYREIDELYSIIKSTGLSSSEIIKYIKKRISIMQATLGIKIKFFNAALDVFIEKMLLAKIAKEENLDSLAIKQQPILIRREENK